VLPVTCTSREWEAVVKDVRGPMDLLWYPSAGKDFRPLLEFSRSRLSTHGFAHRPSLFIFTDGSVDPRRFALGAPLFQDRNTRVECQSIEPVRAELFSHLDASDLHSVEHSSGSGAALLKVSIESQQLGVVCGNVLYLPMSNFQFLHGWIGEAGVRIGSLVRVRMGLGLGGCLRCLAPMYPWLSWMGFRQLLLDGEAHIDESVRIRTALERHGFPSSPPKFEVRLRNPVTPQWSGYDVVARTIHPVAGVFDSPAAERSIISQLSTGSWRERVKGLCRQ